LVSEIGGIKDINGVMPFLAPELLSGRGSYSQATDVYAFGIIMCEIIAEEKPFHNILHDRQLALRIFRGLRPEITKDTPQFYQNLMRKCWHADPTQRPSAKEIKYQLKIGEEFRNFKSCAEKIREIQKSIPWQLVGLKFVFLRNLFLSTMS